MTTASIGCHSVDAWPRPLVQAAEDSRQQMGNRRFYDQMLSDVCRHQQQQVTDEIDITNMKEYMKVRFSHC